MKKNIPMVIAVISCLLTVVCLFKIAGLKSELSNVRSGLSSQMENVNMAVNNIYSEVDSKLREQASLLSDSSYEYGAPDIENRTVALRCSVTPKEFSPAGTTALLLCNGQEYPMTLENGAFTASVDLPLFIQAEVVRVQFSENGVLRTESLNWAFTPRYDFLPGVYATLSGTAEGGSSYHRTGIVGIDFNIAKAPAEVSSIDLVEVLDGKEIGRTPIALNESTDRQGYAAAAPAENKDGAYHHFSYELDKTYSIPNGSTHALYVEVTDGYGLHYRVLIDRVTVDESGHAASDGNDWQWQASEAAIFDTEGNTLYDVGNIKY